MKNIKHVLIIESDGVALTILKKCLELAGYYGQASFTLTAFEAKEYLAKQEGPLLIFIEPFLPDCKVQDFLQWLHEKNVFLNHEVYILSAILPEILAPLCEGFKHARCLAKPVHPYEIKKILKANEMC